MARERVEGLNKLMKDIRGLEKMPQKQITKGARKGAKVILNQARAIAKTRRKSGKMWKKITLRAERNKPKGKKVFRITYPKTEKFPEAVKITKDGKQYYYPSSQNYGFKNKYMKKKVEGLQFFEKSFEQKHVQSARVMVEEIGKEIEKMLSEGGN